MHTTNRMNAHHKQKRKQSNSQIIGEQNWLVCLVDQAQSPRSPPGPPKTTDPSGQCGQKPRPPNKVPVAWQCKRNKMGAEKSLCVCGCFSCDCLCNKWMAAQMDFHCVFLCALFSGHCTIHCGVRVHCFLLKWSWSTLGHLFCGQKWGLVQNPRGPPSPPKATFFNSLGGWCNARSTAAQNHPRHHFEKFSCCA